MSKKRILVIYSTAGAGHRKAAYAIKDAFGEIGSDASVDIIDALDYTAPLYKWSYPRFYLFMVNRIPFIWGLGYYALDNKIFYGLVSWLRHLGNWISSRPLARYLRREDYDVIITTHFLPPDVITMESGKIRSKLINVITDYRVHSFWYAKATYKYVVGHEIAKEELILRYGVPEDMIAVLGIPIDPVFSKTKGKEELKRRLGVKEGLFTVLIGSGGFGVGPVEELVRSFKGTSLQIQLLVVCGKNDALRSSIGSIAGEVGVPMKVYGFVDNMDELMEAADVIITKTGGLMSSEAMSKDLPIIGIAPIPGQETRNFEILVKLGVVIEGKNVNQIPGIVERLYNDKEFLNQMKEKIKYAKKPSAAHDIARLALEV